VTSHFSASNVFIISLNVLTMGTELWYATSVFIYFIVKVMWAHR
jgi:hypothetical protein